MTTKTKRSQDAARTPATPTAAKAGAAVKHGGPTERARKEVRKTIAANIARIEKDEARVANGDHGGEQEQPKHDQQQHTSPELAHAAAPGGAAPEAHRGADAPTAARAPAQGGKRGKKAKDAQKPVPAAEVAPAPKPAKVKRLSCIDAAAQVLAANKGPMSAKDMIAEMKVQNLWSSPNGKTPEASLYAAVVREIAAKGVAARFKKVDRGLFVANTK